VVRRERPARAGVGLRPAPQAPPVTREWPAEEDG
jgi:hypothetical protein